MTCKDCIHCEVCAKRKTSITLDPVKCGYRCPDLKNKADYAEVKHGYWIGKPIAGYARIRCSVCRTSFAQETGTWKYCPECSAKMDGGNTK